MRVPRDFQRQKILSGQKKNICFGISRIDVTVFWGLGDAWGQFTTKADSTIQLGPSLVVDLDIMRLSDISAMIFVQPAPWPVSGGH